MFVCDTSSIDWNAWGTVGTWVVGLAALYIAGKANSISTELRNAERRREEQTSHAAATGLRLDFQDYALRLENCAVALKAWGDAEVGPFDFDQAIDSFDRIATVRVSEQFSNMASLPPALAKRVSYTYAQTRVLQKSTERIIKLLTRLQGLPRDHAQEQQARERLAETGTQLMRVSAQVLELVDALGDYIGFPQPKR